jgi:hypothetical protein
MFGRYRRKCSQTEPVYDLLIFTSGMIVYIRDDVPVARQRITKTLFDGERELILGEPRTKTIVAETFVEGWRLKRSSLSKMVTDFPHIKRLLMSNARQRYPREFMGLRRKGDIFADPVPEEASSGEIFQSDEFVDSDVG